jgi:hypothetical protein
LTTEPPRPTTPDAAVADEFFDALTAADEQHAVDLATGLVEAGHPVSDVLLRLVGPAQGRVGLPMHLPGARRTIAAAQRTGTPVLAGGPGFGTDGRWARKLGVDAYAATAAEAVALLDSASWSATPAAVQESGGAEYAGLRERRAALVQDAVARMGGAAPLGDGDAYDDASQLVDFLAAAVYLADPDLFGEHVRWLAAVATARRGSATAVPAALDALAAGLHDFPLAQDCIARGRAAQNTAAPDNAGGGAG